MLKLQRLSPPRVPLTYEPEVKSIESSNTDNRSSFFYSHYELLNIIANYTNSPANRFFRDWNKMREGWSSKKIVMFWMNKLISIHKKVEKNKSSSILNQNQVIALENLLLLITLKINQKSIVAPINNIFRSILSIFLPIIFIVIRN
ncbi:hypothetical protein, partial [Acinetobacter sp. NRRL B-65365]|uniref:hypothetical protein n=1 Tax=Acinetobacter sp. NRRL B-65365 TaxID=1785092 RepID=UPI000AC118B2